MRLVVGNIDAGVAVLLSHDHYVLEVPTFMLPPDVAPGVAVDLDFTRNRAADARKSASFAALVARAAAGAGGTPLRAPELRLVGSTAHSLSLAWFGGSCGRPRGDGARTQTKEYLGRRMLLAHPLLASAGELRRHIAYAIDEPVFELLLDDKPVLSSCGPVNAHAGRHAKRRRRQQQQQQQQRQLQLRLDRVAAVPTYTDGSISDAAADDDDDEDEYDEDEYDEDDYDDRDVLDYDGQKGNGRWKAAANASALLEAGQHVFEGLEADTSYDAVARITTQDGCVELWSNRLRLRTLPDHMRMPLPISPSAAYYPPIPPPLPPLGGGIGGDMMEAAQAAADDNAEMKCSRCYDDEPMPQG